mmetsp:Transcript_1056/g.2472  ORF Transcript_1056/g.2472 Transcript_1056/m.2472 type:complete len:241 (+) Transcript_1056:304-1026(+)
MRAEVALLGHLDLVHGHLDDGRHGWVGREDGPVLVHLVHHLGLHVLELPLELALGGVLLDVGHRRRQVVDGLLGRVVERSAHALRPDLFQNGFDLLQVLRPRLVECPHVVIPQVVLQVHLGLVDLLIHVGQHFGCSALNLLGDWRAVRFDGALHRLDLRLEGGRNLVLRRFVKLVPQLGGLVPVVLHETQVLQLLGTRVAFHRRICRRCISTTHDSLSLLRANTRGRLEHHANGHAQRQR